MDLCEKKLDATRPADISKEFDVTPQLVNSWKTRNVVPYKYVKALRKKIYHVENSNRHGTIVQSGQLNAGVQNPGNFESFEIDILAAAKTYYEKIIDNYIIIISLTLLFGLFATIRVYFFIDPIYTASATLLPSVGKSSSSQLGGLANKFGLNVGLGSSKSDEIESVDLYPVLIYSKTIFLF